MDSIKIRLNQLIDNLHLSKNEFAREVGTSSAMISKITTKDVNFGVDVFQKIVSRYTNLNQQWLLTGIGEMWSIRPSIDPKSELEKLEGKNPMKEFSKKNNKVLNSLEEYSKNDLTLRQLILVHRNQDKARVYFRKIEGEYSGLLNSVEEFIFFPNMANIIIEEYFSKLSDLIYIVPGYLSGEKFDSKQYKLDIENELEKLKLFKLPLLKFAAAIEVFYNEFNELDPKKILDNF